MQRIILHIDFDSFFASSEQQDNPLFRNRPIGVTATNGRTCIIAASREAKAAGVKSPSRTFEAQKICPSIVFVPAHFTRYWEISKKFINICSDFSPFVEIFSLDEVFMDVTQTAELFAGTYALIEKIKTRLKQEIGECVTASFGISHNKLLSKLASCLAKPARNATRIALQAGPNGIVTIREMDVLKVYQRAKLTDVCGIGARIEERLNQMGIYTLLQLGNAPLSALCAEFGEAEGKFLENVGAGADNSPVIPFTIASQTKSVSRSYCLPANEYDSRKVLQNVYELSEEIGIKLRRLSKKARTIGISLRGAENIHGYKTYSNFLDSGKDIFEACQSVMNQESGIRNYGSSSLIHNSLFVIPEYVRQISIWASNLEDCRNIPSSLFDTVRKKELLETIDKINEKFGAHTIRNGFLLNAEKLTTAPNGYMADRYERLKLVEKEQAGS